VIDELSDHDVEVLVSENIGSVLHYHYCEKETILVNNDTAKEFTANLSNVTWE
jgi:hypothetical protein